MQEELESLGNIIRDLRKELGLTQKELATKANISVRELSTVENERSLFCADVVRKIANALGIDLENQEFYYGRIKIIHMTYEWVYNTLKKISEDKV